MGKQINFYFLQDDLDQIFEVLIDDSVSIIGLQCIDLTKEPRFLPGDQLDVFIAKQILLESQGKIGIKLSSSFVNIIPKLSSSGDSAYYLRDGLLPVIDFDILRAFNEPIKIYKSRLYLPTDGWTPSNPYIFQEPAIIKKYDQLKRRLVKILVKHDFLDVYFWVTKRLQDKILSGEVEIDSKWY